MLLIDCGIIVFVMYPHAGAIIDAIIGIIPDTADAHQFMHNGRSDMQIDATFPAKLAKSSHIAFISLTHCLP
jgi:hypothetical protein